MGLQVNIRSPWSSVTEKGIDSFAVPVKLTLNLSDYLLTYCQNSFFHASVEERKVYLGFAKLVAQSGEVCVFSHLYCQCYARGILVMAQLKYSHEIIIEWFIKSINIFQRCQTWNSFSFVNYGILGLVLVLACFIPALRFI